LFITQHNAFGRRTGAGKDARQKKEKDFSHNDDSYLVHLLAKIAK
jgi:hypothetical protein